MKKGGVGWGTQTERKRDREKRRRRDQGRDRERGNRDKESGRSDLRRVHSGRGLRQDPGTRGSIETRPALYPTLVSCPSGPSKDRDREKRDRDRERERLGKREREGDWRQTLGD